MKIGPRKTRSIRKEDVSPKWIHIDATDQVLGRMASRVALILQGKHRPSYTPHVDTGDYVVITNAEKIRITGNKLQKKMHYHHTGYIGGLVAKPAKKIMEEAPEELIRLAIRRMLPKSKLGKQMFKKLKVYRSETHPHQAQAPVATQIPG